MLKYILKRIFIFIPTLFAISLITFIISLNAPGDPVDMMLNQSNGGEGQSTQKLATEKAYWDLKHKLGLDLPVFYLSFTNASLPDTLFKIQKLQHRKALERLCDAYGNWEYISPFYIAARNLDFHLYTIQRDSAYAVNLQKAKDATASILGNYEEKKIQTNLSELNEIINSNQAFASVADYLRTTKEAYNNLLLNKKAYKKYFPAIHFYGLHNQYHTWLFGDKPWFSNSTASYISEGFFRGDFGMSYQDKRPVKSVIWDAVRWTMLISTLSIIIAYFIAIPLGVKSAVNKGSRSDKTITTFLFMLYSLPNFWIATMAILFLCGGDYLNWFPAFGMGTMPEDAPFFAKFSDTAYHLVLPLFCWTYGSFAFLSRQMRGGMLNVIGQDYIRTARAKGLPENKVIWQHAFRNSLLPIITIFANIFPAVISGSFVIEWIFSIPGMGKIGLEAVIGRNYPIVFTEMMFAAILTLVGTLVADILYAAVDPRISFTSKKG